MKYVAPAILALATLCEALQKNQTGAQYLVALVAIGAIGFVVYWAAKAAKQSK